MTKSNSSGGVRTRSKKRSVDHVVKMVFRRKVCMFCFLASLLIFALLLGAAIALTVLTVKNWKDIDVYLRKQKSLGNRSDIEAFYEMMCPIYTDDANTSTIEEWETFELAFCNRYCERNRMFEFMYRQIDTNITFEDSKLKSSDPYPCPIFVEFKQCQTEEKGSHCEEKTFNEEFVQLEVGVNNTLVGACVPCSLAEN